MIPQMEPPIVSSESCPIAFDESDPEKMLMLELIKERYEAIEHPFLTSSRDGFTYLIIPQTVSKIFFAKDDAQQITAETPGPLSGPSTSRG